MKNRFIQTKVLTVLGILGLLILLSSYGSFQNDDVRLKVESNHSTIQFYVPISNGITRISGKFTEYSMDIAYDSINFINSKISVVINSESVNTGITGRDEHLRTADFFDVEKYPEITFESTSITQTEEENYTMTGNFSMHGTTNEIEMPLTITGKEGKYTVGFSTRLSIDRTVYGVGSDFKHTSMENFIGNMVAIEIDFWTKKWKAPKTE